ncbi:MAG: YgfZ/GcvT domain-containing protein [Gemmatimonadales bacterium]
MTVPALPAAPPARVRRLHPDSLSPAVLDTVNRGAAVAPVEAAVTELIGPGAVACFQGLLTNDIETPGDGAFLYGALLTPKGMIVVEGWAGRTGAAVRYTVPGEGRDALLALLARSVPPRLARTVDRSADLAVLRLAGPRAAEIARTAGLPVPTEPGRAAQTDDVEIARPANGAPFALQLTAPADRTPDLQARLTDAGALASPAALELHRVLAGWPRLGAEVDAKTIPQEVRYDEVGGVSYTKGCYTGQETVSRLHFRGHANRLLRGLAFDAPPEARDPLPVTLEDRDVGRVTTLVPFPDGRCIGLAVLRREAVPGMTVRAGGTDARVIDLPFSLARLEPA